MPGNDEQAEFWSGDAGRNWVAQQQSMDAFLSPVLEGVLARAALAPGQVVLDVGCGTGQSTLAAAEIAGPGGHVLGADISPPMLAQARQRAEDRAHVRFAAMDVAAHAFAAETFDRVISRFGVMFFADPVAAFTNIAGAMKPGARMVFASWGRIEENPYFTLPARIAREVVGAPPKSDPDEPGPFAFRDIAKVEGILRASGLRQVAGEAAHLSLSLPGGAPAIARLSTRIGPASRALTYFKAEESARQRIEDRLAEAIGQMPDQSVPAEINFFTATR